MATSTLPASIEKKSLENTPMYISRVQSSYRSIVYCLGWEICGFGNLEKEIRYKTNVPRLRWCLSLYKDTQTLYVNVVVPFTNYSKIECYMICSPRIFIDVQETGRYEYQIPFATIQDPKNKLISEEDKLSLGFRFTYCESFAIIRPFFNRRLDKETCMLENELRGSIVRSKKFEPNFSLRLKDCNFHFRKEFLAARCKFFYDYLKRNPDSAGYHINTRREVMERVGRYLMFGSTVQATELESLMDNFMLAIFLKIPSLQFQYDVLAEGLVKCLRQTKCCTRDGQELVDSMNVFLRKKQELRLSGKLFV